jgi:NCS2 family nucleobase:cation symporter-2
LNLLLPEEDLNEEMESLAGDIADRNEAELENAEDPKFANPSKGESAQSGDSSKFVSHQNVDSMDVEGKA